MELEKFIPAEEIIEKYTNEFTLINAVKNGIVTPYDKQFTNPIDVKKIVNFFEEARRYTNLQRGAPTWAIDEKEDLPNECNKLFPIYEIAYNRERRSWTGLYHECLMVIKETDYLEKKNENTEQYVHKIPSCQLHEIWDGFGNSQIREIIFESIFKKEEIENLFCDSIQEHQSTHPPETYIDKLDLVYLEDLWPTASRQQKEGFETFKKKLKADFKNAILAAVAVISYCHRQDKKLTFPELQDLIYRPEKHEGAESLIQYKGISKELIHDIYKELPSEYRHGTGEKKK